MLTRGLVDWHRFNCEFGDCDEELNNDLCVDVSLDKRDYSN